MHAVLTWHILNLFHVKICMIEDASLFKTGNASRFFIACQQHLVLHIFAV
jgi:hypothetical protein